MTSADSNTTGGGFLDGDYGGQAGSLTYGIAVSAGILILIATITLASYFCTRDTTTDSSSTPPPQSRRRNRTAHHHQTSPDDDCVVIEIGIDEATLLSYPKMPYSKAKANDLAGKEDSSASCCSICLADYKSKDVVRLLPDCSHVFHQGCVDPWLRSHPTCPVCRTSPLPTPLSTPLAEVVPLAVNRRN